MKKWVSSVLAVLFVGCASVASAVTVTYTDQATFLGALGSSTTEDFEGFAAGTVIASLTGITTVSTDGENGSTQAEVGSIATIPFPMTNGLPTSSGDHFLSSELAGPTFATAGLIFQLDSLYDGVGFYVVDGAPLGGFTINLFDGAVLVGSASFAAQTLPSSFIGATSTLSFDRIEIDADNGGDSWGIDDLSLGKTASVPEPTVLGLLGLGLAGLGARRARRSTR